MYQIDAITDIKQKEEIADSGEIHVNGAHLNFFKQKAGAANYLLNKMLIFSCNDPKCKNEIVNIFKLFAKAILRSLA